MKLISFLLIVAMTVGVNASAEAKGKSNARAFSFFDDGGKHSQGECDPEKKAPPRLKRKKEVSKFKGYLGSELIESAQESASGSEAWKHYFSSSASCNETLHSLPSAN